MCVSRPATHTNPLAGSKSCKWVRGCLLVPSVVVVLAWCGGCAAPPGRDGRGGTKALFAGLLLSRRQGYGLNEGRDISLAEGFRAVPYLGIIPKLTQGFAARSGRTSYEALYENDLLPSTYGSYSLDALSAAEAGGLISRSGLQEYGSLLARGGHSNLETISRCHSLGLIGREEQKALIGALVKPAGELSDVALDLHPQNKGLYGVAYGLGLLTLNDFRRVMVSRLRRPDFLCAQTVVEAHRAGVIDGALRTTCLEYVLCRTQVRILSEARRAGKEPSDYRSKLRQFKLRKARLRKSILASAKALSD